MRRQASMFIVSIVPTTPISLSPSPFAGPYLCVACSAAALPGLPYVQQGRRHCFHRAYQSPGGYAASRGCLSTRQGNGASTESICASSRFVGLCAKYFASTTPFGRRLATQFVLENDRAPTSVPLLDFHQVHEHSIVTDGVDPHRKLEERTLCEAFVIVPGELNKCFFGVFATGLPKCMVALPAYASMSRSTCLAGSSSCRAC